MYCAVLHWTALCYTEAVLNCTTLLCTLHCFLLLYWNCTVPLCTHCIVLCASTASYTNMRDNGTESTHLQLYHSTQIVIHSKWVLQKLMVPWQCSLFFHHFEREFFFFRFSTTKRCAAKSVKLNNEVVRQIKSIRCDVIIFTQITRLRYKTTYK